MSIVWLSLSSTGLLFEEFFGLSLVFLFSFSQLIPSYSPVKTKNLVAVFGG